MSESNFDVDEILRTLHRRLSKTRANTPEAAKIAGLIGPITHLYRKQPINAIHEERLQDFLKQAMVAIQDTTSPDDK